MRTRRARSMPIFMVAVDEAHVPHAPCIKKLDGSTSAEKYNSIAELLYICTIVFDLQPLP